MFVGTALVLGGLAFGFDPVTLLSGTTVGVSRGLTLILAGTPAYLLR